MAENTDRLDNLIVKIRENGHRLTPQRLAVINILCNSHSHPTVEQIYARVKEDFPMTSLATVYKTVTILKEMGEVLELSIGGESNHYDGLAPNPHPHLVCVKCKSIVDADILPEWNDLSQEVSQLSGYQILSHRLDFFGVCPQCQ